MRFHRLALSATALLAVSVLSGHNGLARADEDVDVDVPEETPEAEEAAPYVPPEGSEEYEFEAEVHKMLDIVVNSLYQNKDVFLRELISNASDALDKVRFLGLTSPEILGDKPELEVKIQYDTDAKTLTITDSGIGMTHDDLVKNLGTVARSGTTKFLESLGDKEGDVSMIGQFGVGFYSAFLVAERVTVASKHPDDPVQHIWESINGESSFHVADDPRGNSLGRGTEITLHLKEDAHEYADAMRVKDLATHYSEFITHPIHMRTTTTVEVEDKDDEDEVDEEEKKEEADDEDDLEVKDEDEEEEEKEPPKMKEVTTYSWEQINTNQAIWTRDKDEITDDEYQAFWKVVSKESHENATSWIHFNAEGNINFKSLLYLPTEIPPNLASGNFAEIPKGGLKLYVQKVLISDEFELMPKYLSFIKGVIDSDDLPLNVNRETLQESKIIKVIQKKLVRKAIEMIRKLSLKEGTKTEEEVADAEVDENGNLVDPDLTFDYNQPPPYFAWYKKFAPSLKMGVIEDNANRNKIAKLLRFKSSKTKDDDDEEDWVSLEDYIERMKEWQEDIYVFAGTSQADLEKSQFMERFVEKDIEVIFLTEPVDEYMVQHMREFEGKKFTSITKDGITFKDEDEDLVKRRDKYYTKMFKPLTKYLKKLFGQTIMRVTISKRLGKAPAIVSSSEYGHSANMERIMRAQAFQHGQDENMVRAMRILEINPRHPLIHKLLDGCPPEEKKGDDDEEEAEPFEVDEKVVDTAWMLLDMALLNGGFPIEDHETYSKRVMRVLQSQMEVDSLDLEDEVDPPIEEEEAPEVDLEGMEGINLEDLEDLDVDLDEEDI